MPPAMITSRFGMREHPILGFSALHAGVDFAAPPGTPILAAGDGTVELQGMLGSIVVKPEVVPYLLSFAPEGTEVTAVADAHHQPLVRELEMGGHAVQQPGRRTALVVHVSYVFFLHANGSVQG